MRVSVATLRLDRLLANLGYGSRRDVQKMVEVGWIVLDDEVVREADRRVAVTADLPRRLSVHGAPLDPPPGVTLLMHKPLGVTCSHKETGPLVYELLPSRWRRRDPALSTIGRLDKETSGLLLFTDDGALLHRVISPRQHVPKRYVAELDRPLRGDEHAIFAAGTLMLEGETKPLLRADMETLGPTTARVTIVEGRYHQVRRMFAAVGNHITALHRDRVGALELGDDLPPGAWRILDQAGVTAIFDGESLATETTADGARGPS